MHGLLSLLLLQVLLNPANIQVGQGDKDRLPSSWISLNDVTEASMDKSYWLKVEIKKTDGRYLLQGGNWYMTNIHFYDDQLDLIHVGNRIEINLNRQSKSFYLFYDFHDAKDPDHFSIRIIPLATFIHQKFEKDLFQVSFHAILSFILCISIFFAIRNRDIVYRNYAYYIGSILLFFSYQYGLLASIFSPIGKLPPSWMWIVSASISHAYLLFTMSFLDLKSNDPYNYRVALFAEKFILLVVMSETIALLFQYDIMHQLWYKSLVIIIELGIMIVFISRIAMMNTTISNIYIIGAFVLLISSITGQVASTFKIAYETNVIVQSGLVFDLFILSIGIAVRVGLIQKSKQETQSKLIAQLRLNEQLQQDYTFELESKVKERTEALNQRNKENETLLKEVHHRVKNNLQMITSMLNMQQRRFKEDAAKKALALTKNRVKSIALIHEHLYRHDDFSQIDLKEYVEELVFILIDSLYRGPTKIKTSIVSDQLMVDIETAIPVGLIINELVTNSIKHAFQDHKDPELTVILSKKDETLVIEITDNGKGIARNSDQLGFGNTIVQVLLDNHTGQLEYPEKTSGFTARVILRNFKALEL